MPSSIFHLLSSRSLPFLFFQIFVQFSAIQCNSLQFPKFSSRFSPHPDAIRRQSPSIQSPQRPARLWTSDFDRPRCHRLWTPYRSSLMSKNYAKVITQTHIVNIKSETLCNPLFGLRRGGNAGIWNAQTWLRFGLGDMSPSGENVRRATPCA